MTEPEKEAFKNWSYPNPNDLIDGEVIWLGGPSAEPLLAAMTEAPPDMAVPWVEPDVAEPEGPITAGLGPGQFPLPDMRNVRPSRRIPVIWRRGLTGKAGTAWRTALRRCRGDAVSRGAKIAKGIAEGLDIVLKRVIAIIADPRLIAPELFRREPPIRPPASLASH